MMRKSIPAMSAVLAALTGVAEEDDRPARRMTSKCIGEISEVALALKARTMGFMVAKRWGDSELYDFVVGWGTRLWRVQLKCTLVIHSRAYEVQSTHSVYGKGKRAYSAREIDALVVHIPPCDATCFRWRISWDRTVCGSIRTLNASGAVGEVSRGLAFVAGRG